MKSEFVTHSTTSGRQNQKWAMGSQEEGLLGQMTHLVGRTEPSIHPALATYLPTTSSLPCLSLSCSSLGPVCRSLPSSLDLATTRDTPDLARHFMLQLHRKDREKECEQGMFGYAAIFQFYLDFYGLAVESGGVEGRVAFPARPQEGRDYLTAQFSYRDPGSPGWRSLGDIRAALNLSYWTSHPLRQGAWRSYDEDHDMWAKAAEALVVEEVSMEEVLVLADAMARCCARLAGLHSKFHKDLITREGDKPRRCQIL